MKTWKETVTEVCQRGHLNGQPVPAPFGAAQVAAIIQARAAEHGMPADKAALFGAELAANPEFSNASQFGAALETAGLIKRTGKGARGNKYS